MAYITGDSDEELEFKRKMVWDALWEYFENRDVGFLEHFARHESTTDVNAFQRTHPDLPMCLKAADFNMPGPSPPSRNSRLSSGNWRR